MFCIEKNKKIILTRGDNAEIDVRVFNLRGEEVQILPSDTITFTMRKTPDSEIALQKTASLNSIFIYPEDTEDLACGLYTYDIDFVRDNEVQTIVPQSFFELRREI